MKTHQVVSELIQAQFIVVLEVFLWFTPQLHGIMTSRY